MGAPISIHETIGPCEWCGRVDHHLVLGPCSTCNARAHWHAPGRYRPSHESDPLQAINRDTVLAVLANRIGKDRGAHAGELVRELTGQASTAAAERWLRQIITQLRLEGSHICAHP